MGLGGAAGVLKEPGVTTLRRCGDVTSGAARASASSRRSVPVGVGGGGAREGRGGERGGRVCTRMCVFVCAAQVEGEGLFCGC